MSARPVTPAELVDLGLMWEPYLKQSKKAKVFYKHLPYQLAGVTPVRWSEEDVTRFMGMTIGALEVGMLRMLSDAAGIAWSDDLQLITGTRLLRASKLGSRNLDLAIARWHDEGMRWAPLAAIEAKFDAQVNGDRRCTNPKHKGRYTNQIICYPMGCGHPDLRHDENSPGNSTPFVWLWNKNVPSLVGVPMGLSTKDEHSGDANIRQAWADAWELQEQYRKVWKVATWARLRDSVSAELRAKGFEKRIIDAVLRPLTPRSMPRDWKLEE